MKPYNFTWEETVQMAETIISKVYDDMGITGQFTWGVTIPEEIHDTKKEFPWSNYGEFKGNAHNLSNSVIEFIICNVNKIKGKNKLQVWKASIKIQAIHEACHFLHWKSMSLKERAGSTELYDDTKTWGRIEEIATWNDTFYWLKKLRYYRAASTYAALDKYIFPKNYQLPSPFSKRL